MGDIREINVFDGSEKIVAKVLTNRLQTVFKEMLDNYQMDFISDRYMLDGVRRYQSRSLTEH